jgi:hypothetical protein
MVRHISGWSHFLIRPSERINCWHASARIKPRPSLGAENSLLFTTAKTEWKILDEAISWSAPIMTVSGDMPNEKYREVSRATIAELRQPRHLQARPEQGARAGRKQPRHLANRSDLRKIENEDSAF